jgi:hypothetical protein
MFQESGIKNSRQFIQSLVGSEPLNQDYDYELVSNRLGLVKNHERTITSVSRNPVDFLNELYEYDPDELSRLLDKRLLKLYAHEYRNRIVEKVYH